MSDSSGFLGNGRSAKIVATLGPSSSSEEVFRSLVRAGLDVARLNFSHGSHEQKAELIAMVRKVSKEEGKPICILADLQGPKIRTGRLVGGKPVLLEAGKQLIITPNEMEGTAEKVSTVFTTLAENLSPGDTILLSDGLIELTVAEIQGTDVVCDIINGGMLGEKKGINLPGIAVNVPALTEKDEEDLVFIATQGVHALALSFVRTAEDIRYARRRMKQLNCTAWVVAKLEKPQAIENLEEILEETDALMVARGDLGVEVPPEKVPAIQKHIIRRALAYRKPVITATQMLESMIDNPRPTRAEVSDVANAVYDGTDAVMLSAESAAGKYPVQAVAMMAKIIVESEAQMALDRSTGPRPLHHARGAKLSVAETICESMAHSAEDLDLSAIAIFTETGTSARLISMYRPNVRIFALSNDEEVIGKTMMLWGVHSLSVDRFGAGDLQVSMAEETLRTRGFVKAREILGIVGGTASRIGGTNFMKLHEVSDQ
ncbi:pyruvate kinase [Terriglobus roseus DSM 18391]|uniref:Pyruvate kinase n=1 Tax=Terriglobus roseus (strain DSM 18391 / NRRL B-41598 / KBS 63) TaxID=926566 RepID=I3ZLG9_TERRK|nr:pyruvate kinase [Terriglobus roseus]AFL90087.1 pyruvate kinase [Terriglobus roseus DSM 18391]